MYLLYFPHRNEFVRYDNFRFVGLQEEKKFWHFLKKMPANLLEILNESGFQAAEPTDGQSFFEEKRRFLRLTAQFSVYDLVQQKNVTGTGKDWVDALNNLAGQLTKVNSANPAA